VAQECLELGAHENDVIAARAWTVLMRVRHPEGRRHLLPHALAEQRSSVRSRALLNVGLARGPLPTDHAAEILDGITESSRPIEQHAAMFALGMSGASQLRQVAKDDSHWAAASARWWLEHGPAVHDDDADPDPVVRSR
jgi:hypothetical protein